jgi:outer membrane receptor protein involved in Fe transport
MQPGTCWFGLVLAVLSVNPAVSAAEGDDSARRAASRTRETADASEDRGERASFTIAHEIDAVGSQRTPETARLEEVLVEAKRPLSAASSDEIRAQDYELRPHATTQEILNNIPGLVVNQHQGGGKAMQYLIRGFDSDHGTDLALFVDGLPVNLPTHGHGQGYADLNFLIPETVDRVQLYKGPYFTDLGDFATAGALRFVTLDEFRESFVRAEGGSFDTQRYVAGVSPRLGNVKTLLAAEAYFSNGPFDNPNNFARYNVFSKLTLEPNPGGRLSLSGSVYASDWDASGQIPLREVTDGRLDRFGSEDPTEGGKSDRQNLNAIYSYRPTAEDEWAFQVYGSRYSLRLYSNFTFFRDTGLRFVRQNADGLVCDTTQPGAACTEGSFIPGDGIDQDDQRLLFGGRASYTRSWALTDFPIQSRVAIETRRDEIDVALHRQVRRQRFYTINRVHAGEQSLAAFTDHQVFFTDRIRFEAGLRGDVYFFDARDRLPAQGTDPNFEPVRIDGNEVDSIVSPKANLIVTPVNNTDVYLNFGTGFHSNDARSVIRTGADGLVRALGYELGVRTRQLDRLDAAAAIWLLDSDGELVFSGDGGDVDAEVDPVSGSFIPGPASRRWGIDFETRYRFTDWLFADYDLSYADPRFRPSGGAVPLAPTLLMNGGLTLQLDNGFSAALRLRYVGDRPANEDRSLTARGYTLLDLLAAYRWRNVEATIAFLNVTATDWREAQFADSTCVLGEEGIDPRCPPQGNGEGVEDIHFTPGNPFGVRGGLTVYF